MADGLEGVIAAETRLSMVDGAAGRLVIRGYDVESLVEGPPFETMLYFDFEAEEPRQILYGRTLAIVLRMFPV